MKVTYKWNKLQWWDLLKSGRIFREDKFPCLKHYNFSVIANILLWQENIFDNALGSLHFQFLWCCELEMHLLHKISAQQNRFLALSKSKETWLAVVKATSLYGINWSALLMNQRGMRKFSYASLHEREYIGLNITKRSFRQAGNSAHQVWKWSIMNENKKNSEYLPRKVLKPLIISII